MQPAATTRNRQKRSHPGLAEKPDINLPLRSCCSTLRLLGLHDSMAGAGQTAILGEASLPGVRPGMGGPGPSCEMPGAGQNPGRAGVCSSHFRVESAGFPRLLSKRLKCLQPRSSPAGAPWGPGMLVQSQASRGSGKRLSHKRCPGDTVSRGALPPSGCTVGTVGFAPREPHQPLEGVAPLWGAEDSVGGGSREGSTGRVSLGLFIFF